MSTIHLAIGMTLAAGVTQAALMVVLPEPEAITVHSLTYIDGVVHQDRTVVAENETFPAEWRAFIMDADTKLPVDGCSGSGFWPYPKGRRVADIPLPEWVGSETCTREYLTALGGQYYPLASWHWGNDGTSKKGKTFTP